MKITRIIPAALILSALSTVQVNGHVALLDPPARNVLWRSGYPELPKHEEDDYLVCQEEKDKHCPPCGDSTSSKLPLPHQAGGKWALGIIARNYSMGESITVDVSVTNSHGGYMEFKLCPNNDIDKPVTQHCLDYHPLEVEGYPDGKVPVTAPYQSTEDIKVNVKLPRGLACTQCVIQMSQYAEQFKPANVMFRNCADIGIIDPQEEQRYSSDHSSQRNTKSIRQREEELARKSLRDPPAPVRVSNRGTSGRRGRGKVPNSAPREGQASHLLSEPISFRDSERSVFAEHAAFSGPSPFIQASSFKHSPSFSQAQFSKRSQSFIIGEQLHRVNKPVPTQFRQTELKNTPKTVQRTIHLPVQTDFSQFHDAFLSTAPLAPLKTIKASANSKQIVNNRSPTRSKATDVGAFVPTKTRHSTFAVFGSKKNRRLKNSGFGAFSSDLPFQTRSKAMFPFHEPRQFPGIDSFW